jgi:hypothetical protein
MRAKSNCVAIAMLLFASPLPEALAQSPASSSTVQVVPVVAQTASYTTEVFVRNQNNVAIAVDVKFYEALTSTTPGLRPCTQLSLAAQEGRLFTLGTQCTLGAGNHHGMLILEDAATVKTHFIGAYSRSQTPGGNGFSVPTFVAGGFSGQDANVIGIKRVAAAPTYQSNCFVGAMGEAVDYQVTLFDGGTNAQIGNAITGTLQPYEMRRYLDIYAIAGLPPGDYTNTRVKFSKDPASLIVGDPAFVGFCTVQENAFFGADFRIAKSQSANNNREKRLNCYAQSPCGTIDNGSSIANATTKWINYVVFTPPDYVKCELVGPRIAELEMQLRGPGGDTFAAPVFPSAPPYSSGGTDQTSFYIFTGNRGAINAGYSQRWFIDVSAREGLPPGTVFPIPFGITCQSGNGVTTPWIRATTTDDF